MQEITLIKPDDFHIHLRQGDLMKDLVREASKSFGRVLAMPNLFPPIVTPDQVQNYENSLKGVGTDLEFVMTFKILGGILPRMIPELRKAGAKAGKLYPQGVTTNSDDGIADLELAYPVFAAMQEENMVLCIHGERPGSDPMTAEKDFMPDLEKIVRNFPRLRIVLEHVSSEAGIETMKRLPETIAATITVHHALLTAEKVQGKPFLHCRPVCKTESDRKAVMAAMVSGNPRFFFGSDSAPHLKAKKEGDHPASGIYTTPVALSLLAEIFEKNNCLDRLEAFTSHFGADFYQLPRNAKKIGLSKEAWTAPEELFGIVPFEAKKKLTWNISLKLAKN